MTIAAITNHNYGYYPEYRGANVGVGNALLRNTITTTAEPTPFYAPDLTDTLPKWDGEKADIDANWVITSVPESHKAKSHKELLTDPSIGGVFFTPKVHNELTYVVEKLADVTGECAMFVLTKQLSPQRPHWLAYDWFLPKQTASSGEVKINIADSERYYDYLMEKYPQEFPNSRKLHEKLMHAHSHHRMSLNTWSSVDHTQQSERTDLAYQGDYRLYFLFTIGYGVKATLVDYTRVTKRSDLFTGICFAEPEYIVALTNKRKRELDERMTKLVSKTYYVTPTVYKYEPTTQATTPNPVMPAAQPVSTKEQQVDAMFEWHEAMYPKSDGMEDGLIVGVSKNDHSPKYQHGIYDMILGNQMPAFERAAIELIVALTNAFRTMGMSEIDLNELAWIDKVLSAVKFKDAFLDKFPVELKPETNLYINRLERAIVEYYAALRIDEFMDEEADLTKIYNLAPSEIKDLIDDLDGVVFNTATYVGESAALYVLEESSGPLSEALLDHWFETDVLAFASTPEDVANIRLAVTSPDDVDFSELLFSLL